MSELPDGIEPAPVPEPLPSALGIVVRRHVSGASLVLLGRRARRARFLPGHLAFPGGKLEEKDRPGEAGAFERCASREVLEETGLAIPPGSWLDAGERTTPPFFSVRYRTRFFAAELPKGASLPASPPAPQEIESLEFASPGRILADWESRRALVPPPLLPIFRAVVQAPAAGIADLAALVAAVNRAEDRNPRIEFVPGVWALPLRTRTLPPATCTNAWMTGGRRFVVVDPGSSESGEIDRLLAAVRKRAAGGDEPAAVVLTHHHRDHVGGAFAVAAALDVPLLAHAATLDRLRGIPAEVTARPLVDGETLDLEGASLEALHTPGHAPGHLAFHVRPQEALVAGDLVSGLSTILVGLDDGDMDAYLASLRRVEALGVATILPAHGPPLPAGAIGATIRHREAREARIVAALASGAARPLAAIARDAYEDTPSAPAFLRELQTRGHLRRLERLGRAARLDPAGAAWRKA